MLSYGRRPKGVKTRMIRDIFTRQAIIGTVNAYYASLAAARRGTKPLRISRIFARRGLFGGWSVYSVVDRPCLPVAHGHRWGLLPFSRVAVTIDQRVGQPQRIAKGLSFADAFARVSRHEISPDVLSLPGRPGRDAVTGGVLFLVQTPPRDHPDYWRNLRQPGS